MIEFAWEGVVPVSFILFFLKTSWKKITEARRVGEGKNLHHIWTTLLKASTTDPRDAFFDPHQVPLS